MHGEPISFDQLQARMREHVQELTGKQDMAGVELSALLRVASNFFDNLAAERGDACELSSARMGLLMRLYGEERRGGREGLTPTHLSRSDQVSKNTISAHLRGLEEQGLITREIDAQDKRLFRIRLTDAGRDLVRQHAPGHIRRLNQLAGVLTEDEQAQLNSLLKKLIGSLLACSQAAGTAGKVSEG